ncbi:MAG: RibD family protein [Thermodesulfobacteriota bacterium]
MQEKKVIIIAAMTLCGRIGPALPGSAADRRFLETMRDATDASLMGAGTLRQGNPEMRGRGGSCGRRLRGIITRSGDLPMAGKKIFAQGPRPFIFCGAAHMDHLRSHLADRAEVIVLPPLGDGLSIAAALNEFERRGARAILIEGGSQLNYLALREKVVDEILLTITPRLSGWQSAPSLAAGPAALGSPFLSLELVSCRQEEGGELFTRYRVRYEDDHG